MLEEKQELEKEPVSFCTSVNLKQKKDATSLTSLSEALAA